MIINLPCGFPAVAALSGEGLDLMRQRRCGDGPLRIAILNLMPLKQMTETDLLRVLSSADTDFELFWIRLDSHESRHTSKEHLEKYYRSFSDMEHEMFDGLIVTGAPVEKLDYEDVDYWDELCRIFRWSDSNVKGSTLFICWGALAALYYFYDVPKILLERKISGVFPHRIVDRNCALLRGFDDRFYVPHSRYGTVRRSDIDAVKELSVASESDAAGVHIVEDRACCRYFVTGHSEYAPMTLDFEYHRDLEKGIGPAVPDNYYPDDDPSKHPVVLWRGHAHLLFRNWVMSLR